jgi:hypothetical protein
MDCSGRSRIRWIVDRGRRRNRKDPGFDQRPPQPDARRRKLDVGAADARHRAIRGTADRLRGTCPGSPFAFLSQLTSTPSFSRGSTAQPIWVDAGSIRTDGAERHPRKVVQDRSAAFKSEPLVTINVVNETRVAHLRARSPLHVARRGGQTFQPFRLHSAAVAVPHAARIACGILRGARFWCW